MKIENLQITDLDLINNGIFLFVKTSLTTEEFSMIGTPNIADWMVLLIILLHLCINLFNEFLPFYSDNLSRSFVLNIMTKIDKNQ